MNGLSAEPGERMARLRSSDAPAPSGLEAAMAIENRNQLMAAASPDFREGMSAFLEKRKPGYGAD